jgi:membrane protease YdiL (CAAX protease family)
MFLSFVESIIHLIVLIPFIYFFIEKENTRKVKLLLLFILYFLGYQFIIRLPFHFETLNVFGGKWNWSGKIFTTIGSLIFYYYFKDLFYPNNFITTKQEKKSIRFSIILATVLLLIAIIEGFIFYNVKWNIETIFFQATLPGIDEEIAYRGIMLGILSTVLIKETKLFNKFKLNPAIWIVGILFGLIHALKLNKEFTVSFDMLYFIQTFVFGVIWSWMTVKSKSILLPMLSHNLVNTLPTIIGMLK